MTTIREPFQSLENMQNSPSACALEEMPVVYIEMDLNGVITYANRAARDFHGQEKGIVGYLAWDHMALEERCAHEAEYRRAILCPETPPVIRRSLYTLNGFRTVEIRRSHIFDPSGSVIGMRSISVDVTDEIAQQAELLRSRLWMESILASVSEAILVTDSLGFIRMVNHSAEELFRWKTQELVGQVLERKIPLLEYVTSDCSKLSFQMALHGPARGVAKVLNRYREEMMVEVSASPVIDKENGYTVGVVSLWRKIEPLPQCRDSSLP